MEITLYRTEERCKKCGHRLYGVKWGKGWLWMCLKCLKLWQE